MPYSRAEMDKLVGETDELLRQLAEISQEPFIQNRTAMAAYFKNRVGKVPEPVILDAHRNAAGLQNSLQGAVGIYNGSADDSEAHINLWHVAKIATKAKTLINEYKSKQTSHA